MRLRWWRPRHPRVDDGSDGVVLFTGIIDTLGLIPVDGIYLLNRDVHATSIIITPAAAIVTDRYRLYFTCDIVCDGVVADTYANVERLRASRRSPALGDNE